MTRHASDSSPTIQPSLSLSAPPPRHSRAPTAPAKHPCRRRLRPTPTSTRAAATARPRRRSTACARRRLSLLQVHAFRFLVQRLSLLVDTNHLQLSVDYTNCYFQLAKGVWSHGDYSRFLPCCWGGRKRANWIRGPSFMGRSSEDCSSRNRGCHAS